MKNDPIAVEIDFTAIDALFADEDSSAAEQNCKLITYQDSKTGVILDYSLEPRSPDYLSETDEDGQPPQIATL